MLIKKIIAIVLFVIVISVESTVAQIEINAYGGYVPNSHTMYNYNGYRLQIDGGGNFGVGVGMNTPMGIVAELSYMRFASTIRIQGNVNDQIDPQPINVEYYQLGVQKPLMEGETFVPYGMFSLGASRFNPTENTEDYWRFAVGLGVGIKYFFTDAVGIRLQARMLMPLYFGGVGFGCGIGTGGSSCGGGAYFGTEILQGDFTGGVVLKINN